ncbi:chondroitinase-B domain-containing protein [Photobacterium sp. OFAV2-7]|uniref:chondroitinase-B domain-containing protein n=1 Tax=Photobacterium sp. OFAV2-7 TaxID=2917748 RepID=UPI001EF447B9|nr:chondroitinase-B domain-containing protein [Photobacterium sp. OFAV2-7]MCG7586263.1 right-handed parallel beta-helix repeat-containing protein [Photobacterium sp. OFAV2-7]
MFFTLIVLMVLVLLGAPLLSFAQPAPLHSDILPFGETNRWPTVGPHWPEMSAHIRRPDNAIFVSDSIMLIKALADVLPGQQIVLLNGDYPISSKRLRTTKLLPTKERPITLRALEPGKATLELDSLEGLYLNHPYWRVSGLRFVGKCKQQSRCEHAIHVVGNASHTLIEHNEFIDFNAAIKVNRDKDAFPDHGVIRHNHFFFTAARDVTKPVTPINVDHGNNWLISRNIIRDFIKLGGNQVSYGAFIKGGSIKGTIENNLVICNSTHQDFHGSRIGLSLGGGGMAQQHRREENSAETVGAIVRSNIVIRCNDAGIYINKGRQSTVSNNTLYGTQGIDIRYPQSDTFVANNILNGHINQRDNGKAELEANMISSRRFWFGKEKIDSWFVSPSSGNFSIKTEQVSQQLHLDAMPYQLLPGLENKDFCGNSITSTDRFRGPFKAEKDCFR